MCKETYQKLKKAREDILEVYLPLYEKKLEGDDSLKDIEKRMLDLLNEYDDLFFDYVLATM